MTKQVLPLLQTTWGQADEYAHLVTDLGKGSGINWTNKNIGCQCLALAQILFYHRLQPHHSSCGFYIIRKAEQPDRVVNLTFGEHYFFPEFPWNFIDPIVSAYQKLLVQSYLFDVAKAYRKNFYVGYLHDSRTRLQCLMEHFDVVAKFYDYDIGNPIDTPNNRAYEDIDGNLLLSIADAKLLIKGELSNNRPLFMSANRKHFRQATTYNWSEGWTTANFYTIGSTTYLLLLKQAGTAPDGKNVHIHKMNSNGTVGSQIMAYDWSEGWTTVKIYSFGADSYLLLLKGKGVGRDEKNVHIHLMQSDGKVGSLVDAYKWSEGWTTANIFTIIDKSTSYLLLLKENGVDEDGKNVHIHQIKSTEGHAIVVDGYKEDDDGTFWICCKWGGDSPNNSDQTQSTNPPWFELEKDIGNLDGEKRMFISIQPLRQLA